MRIAIQTSDMRFYYKILNLLQGTILKTKFFSSDQTIPPNKFDLIISKSDYKESSLDYSILRLKEEDLNYDLVLKILGIIARKKEPKFKQLIIGVDPGENIGLAAICDGMVLAAKTSNLKNLSKDINRYLVTFPSEKIIFRVGDQPPSVSNIIFNKLLSIYGISDTVNIEIVEEAFSNSKKQFLINLHDTNEIAAVVIAQRSGKIQDQTVSAEIPIGRITEIQKWSRDRSENRITIDVALARLVALGEITLDEAIEEKEKQLRGKTDD